MCKGNQITELQKDLDTMVGNSSQLKAEKLYAKGWRKQKESEWEISCDGYYPYCKNCGYEPPWVKATDMRTNFCPECGAKMGGAKTIKKYFSPEDVRRMTAKDVADNYTAIMYSMKKWK